MDYLIRKVDRGEAAVAAKFGLKVEALVIHASENPLQAHLVR